ncbi:MAG: DUF452 family protein [Rhodobacteraceae bacterium]|nr:DUF452 family protein [Paracoccaceae bacterium]
MDFHWLKRTEGARRIIVFFGGWAIGPAPLAHLTGPEDVLFADDYRDLAANLPNLSAYDHRALIAFSFGVGAFGHWQAGRGLSFDRRVAINGSLSPIDTRTGIPPRTFQRTLDGLTPDSFQSFLALCSGDAPPPAQLFDLPARRDELIATATRGPAPACPWDRIWISSTDRIFPPANLARAWEDQPDRIRHLDAPHLPFAQFQSWQEILA